MKKFISFLLAAVLLVSAVPTALATNDYSQGTQVVYQATGSESYTITVPAKLAPGGSGIVTLEGIWASDTLVTVTAQENVLLTNSINAVDQKTLDVTFAGISELGSNTESQKFTESVSVANIENAIFGTWNGHFYYTVGTQELNALEQLQEKYEFTYYSTMNGAVNDINNGTVGANSDAEKDTAVAGIYTDENGGANVVLLKDHTEATTISPSVDMTINLGGNTLSHNGITCVDVLGGTLKIDGRLSGSTINVSGTDSAALAIKIQNNSHLILDSGSYTSECNVSNMASVIHNLGGEATVLNCDLSATSQNGHAGAIQSADTAKITVYNCRITATAPLSSKQSCGILSKGTGTISNCSIDAYSVNGTSFGIRAIGTVTIFDCDINAHVVDGKAYGIDNSGTTTASNCDIRAHSNYTYGTENDEVYYLSSSQGVINRADSDTLTLNDCYVMGTHSGMQNSGTVYINGGTFEGYGHGGIYFSGTETTSYVRNATLRDMLRMPEGYTATASHNGAAFYIGGSSGRDNIKVYMDNCDIYSGAYQIALRGAEGEKNNALYISNSTIHDTNGDDIKIRIDNSTHKLYLGVGNNFTAENVFRSIDGASMASAVITTNETYIYN